MLGIGYFPTEQQRPLGENRPPQCTACCLVKEQHSSPQSTMPTCPAFNKPVKSTASKESLDSTLLKQQHVRHYKLKHKSKQAHQIFRILCTEFILLLFSHSRGTARLPENQTVQLRNGCSACFACANYLKEVTCWFMSSDLPHCKPSKGSTVAQQQSCCRMVTETQVRS